MERQFGYEQYNRPEEAGIIELSQIVDRQSIENKAWELLQNREHVPRVEILSQEYEDNARTALMEALTASGHLSRVEISGTLEEINAQVLSRLLNGWDETLPFHEKQRRFAELCNEISIQEIHKLIAADMLPESIQVNEISDFITGVSETTATELGYRHENKKGMVRSTGLTVHEDGTYTRVIEQISRSNGTSESTFAFFKSAGINYDGRNCHDLEALSKPVIYSTEQYADGVIDIQRQLDKYAGGVLYGERNNSLHVSYEELRIESAAREAQIEVYIHKLASLEARLAQKLELGEISNEEKDTQFKNQVRNILESICTLAPEYTEDCFGSDVVDIFIEASNLAAMGHYELAQNLINNNRHLQKTITFCGASISAEKAKELGLEISETGELLSEGKDNWKYKQGICRIEACSSRPGKTEVGPCSICKKCQARFDKGEDPTKDVVLIKTATTQIKQTNASVWDRILKSAA